MLTIGSDPEFLIASDQKAVNASDFFSRRGLNGYGEIGADGSGRPGELRPFQEANPLVHANNIQQLLSKMETKYLQGSYGVRGGNTGGTNEPLGGHIHFGGVSRNNLNNSLYDLVNGLDLVSLMVMQIEEPEYASRRRNHFRAYGQLRTVREQSYGIEYRTPASWLISPTVCKGVLSAYYVVAYDITAKQVNPYLQSMMDWYDGTLSPQFSWKALLKFFTGKLEKNLVTSMFNTCNKEGMEKLVKTDLIRMAIANCSKYPDYKPEIDGLFNMVSEKRMWMESMDVLTNWGVRIPTKLFRFNNDAFIGKIQNKLENPDSVGGKQVIVYGLNRKRGIPIATNYRQFAVAVKRCVENYGWDENEWRVETGKFLKDDKPQIGFDFGLRERKQSDIVQVLNECAKAV